MTGPGNVIGVPREIKSGERRVALTPAGARSLSALGATILVEAGAGDASGFGDAEYEHAGASIVDRPTVFDRADVIVKVKEPLDDEPERLRAGQTLFCYLHLAIAPHLARMLLDRLVTAIAYEHVTARDGSLPLLTPMSTISGRLSVLIGSSFLQSDRSGRGVLISGVPGVPPSTVTVLGCGTVGSNAVRMAVGLGARIVAVDVSVATLARIESLYPGKVETVVSTPDAVARAVAESDLVVGAPLVPGARAPKLLTREMVAAMPALSVIMDVAVDQGGCSETTRPTTHQEPTYIDCGVVHYAVPNIPALVARTATLALTNATLPYLQALATHGIAGAIACDPGLRSGVIVHGGQLTAPVIASELGLTAQPSALERFAASGASQDGERQDTDR